MFNKFIFAGDDVVKEYEVSRADYNFIHETICSAACNESWFVACIGSVQLIYDGDAYTVEAYRPFCDFVKDYYDLEDAFQEFLDRSQKYLF